jgi:hypothetical protein
MTTLHQLECALNVLTCHALGLGFLRGRRTVWCWRNTATRIHCGIKRTVTAAPEVAHFADDLGIILVASVRSVDVIDIVSQAMTRSQ